MEGEEDEDTGSDDNEVVELTEDINTEVEAVPVVGFGEESKVVEDTARLDVEDVGRTTVVDLAASEGVGDVVAAGAVVDTASRWSIFAVAPQAM